MLTLDALIAEGQKFRRVPPAAASDAPRWSLRAEAGAPAHLYLYDTIGWPGIDAQAVVEELRAIHTRPVTVHLNSPGGDVWAGLALYNTLRQHGAPVDVRVEGYAASIASIIAMSGSTLRMAMASMLMLHEPHALVIGTAHDMRAMASLLEQTAGVMADVYAARRVLDRDKIRAWMHKETWWSAREAVAAGLIDAVDDDPIPAEARAASAAFESAGFGRPAPEPRAAEPVHRAPVARHLIPFLEQFAAVGGREP